MEISDKTVQVPISIHALREEGDSIVPYTTYSNYISIHALREEGDPGLRPLLSLHTYFYPRPPRGGRLRSVGRK